MSKDNGWLRGSRTEAEARVLDFLIGSLEAYAVEELAEITGLTEGAVETALNGLEGDAEGVYSVEGKWFAL